jgi:hypothetical protein
MFSLKCFFLVLISFMLVFLFSQETGAFHQASNALLKKNFSLPTS